MTDNGRFKQQWSESDIVAGIDPAIPRTNSAIAEHVGCSRSTAERYIQLLEQENKIIKVTIETGKDKSVTGWVRNTEQVMK